MQKETYISINASSYEINYRDSLGHVLNTHE